MHLGKLACFFEFGPSTSLMGRYPTVTKEPMITQRQGDFLKLYVKMPDAVGCLLLGLVCVIFQKRLLNAPEDGPGFSGGCRFGERRQLLAPRANETSGARDIF